MTQGVDQCGYNTARGEQLDTFLLGRLKARFLKLLTPHREAVIRTLARMLKLHDQPQEHSDSKALAARVEELSQKIDLTLESISTENKGEVNRKIAQWRVEKERLQAEIKRAKEGPKREPHSAKDTAVRAFDLLNELVDVLRNADPRKQKEFIRRCVQKVVLDFVRVPQGRRHLNQLVGGHISYYPLGDTSALGGVMR